MADWYKFRLILVAVVLFIASCVMSVREVRYMMWGELADARVTDVKTVTIHGRYGSTRERLKISYQFNDDTASRNESDTVDPYLQVHRGETISIEFIPGSTGSSRLEGHSQQFWLIVFGGAVIAVGVAGFKFWRNYKS